jgi:dTDP-4-amino-4,6-dideoxygalactose transaminase
VGVGNATDAMEIFLEAIGLKKGDEIIISSHTMLATASAVRVAGGVPVPVDIGDDNLICPKSIEEAITSNTVGIMPTQLNGRVCDMDAIIKIANKHGLFIVEDAAQGLGARYKGKHAGTFGLASCISFFPAKVLGCFGDAGAILVNEKNLYHKVFQIHDHGRDINGEVKRWGRNSRLDNLQAAILRHKLKIYNQVIERRRTVAQMYQDRLGGLDELQLPPSPNNTSSHFDVYQNYEITANNRDELKKYLSEKNIGTLIQWGGKGIHQFQQLGFTQKLPNTDKFFKRCIMLPMNIFISDEDVEYICNSIKSFYRK